MARRYGRGPKGARVHGDAPLSGWRVTTLLGALALDGVRALMTVEAATDTAVFQAFVEQVLVPALRPGDIVVWDNLAPHQAPEVEALVREAGTSVLRLPPYSPDCNPIESCWSKVKTHLRGAAARSKEALDEAIAAAWQAVTPQDARGWFTLCGYQPPS